MHRPAAKPAPAWPLSRPYIWTGSLSGMIGSVPRALPKTAFRRLCTSGHLDSFHVETSPANLYLCFVQITPRVVEGKPGTL
jgi:hypothetical protein